MNILLASIDNPYETTVGGKHNHQLLVEKGLKHLGHNVLVCYPRKSQLQMYILTHAPLYKFLDFSQKNLHKLNFYKHFYENCMQKLSAFPEIIHTHDVISSLYIKTPNILTVHGYLAFETINYTKHNYSENEKNKTLELLQNIEIQAYKKSLHIIAVDNRIKKYILDISGISPGKVTVMHNAIDTDRFRPVNLPQKLKLRKKWNIPINDFLVLVPRRYVEKTGVLVAAQATHFIKDPNIKFLFVGRGPYKKKVEKLANPDNTIIWDGVPYSQMHEIYQLSDVILIPSIHVDNIEEATSLSMLEGMATAKITIVTNVGGLQEIIKNKETGFIIEQNSTYAIRDIILYVKDNFSHLQYIALNARNYVVDNHSYIKYAQNLAKIYMKYKR